MQRQMDVAIGQVTRFPVACMGTMFWFMYNAFKYAGIEQQISNSDLIQFQTTTVTDSREGVGIAAVQLGFSSDFHRDVTQAKIGDLVAIRRNGSIHHWCIAFPSVVDLINQGMTPSVYDDVTTVVNGHTCIGTIGASPEAVGSEGQVGYDYWAHSREEGDRDYVIAPCG
jgi:hypothetical protein